MPPLGLWMLGIRKELRLTVHVAGKICHRQDIGEDPVDECGCTQSSSSKIEAMGCESRARIEDMHHAHQFVDQHELLGAIATQGSNESTCASKRVTRED